MNFLEGVKLLCCSIGTLLTGDLRLQVPYGQMPESWAPFLSTDTKDPTKQIKTDTSVSY